jgi:dihydrofolate synthase/folylpolyglutamate synthase
MRFDTLPEWLSWQENLHFTEVDLGLSRIGLVWEQLKTNTKLPFTVITVAGTNGKGSSVAMLEAILRAAGYKTGTYTSPHLLRYNERIAINGVPSDDASICNAFQRIDNARKDTSLTYFEFATLAAIDIFCEQNIDIAILEVGMGGRLDAVNLFDADIALITPIGLDHINWLGNTRELIGREKAGIIRENKPVVCSEHGPPNSLIDYANSLHAPIYKAVDEYNFIVNDSHWQWSN